MPIDEPAPSKAPRPSASFLWRQARRWVIAVIGGTLLLAGGILFLIPGPPGWPLILGGLGLLATEFAWAGWMLKSAHDRIKRLSSGSRP